MAQMMMQQSSDAPHDSNGSLSHGGTDFFDTQADRWITLYESRPAFRDRLSLFTNAVGRLVPAPGPVLEFGCGPGVLALRLAEMGYDVLGVDGAAKMIDMAREESARRRASNATFDVMNADDLHLPAEAFGAITCSSVIEYVKDDEALLAQFARALKPGGHLFISVPHSGSVVGAVEDLLTMVPGYRNRVGHRHLAFSLRRYRRKDFYGALERHGLTPVSSTYFEGPIPGMLGLKLSRVPAIGLMLLAACQKAR